MAHFKKVKVEDIDNFLAKQTIICARTSGVRIPTVTLEFRVADRMFIVIKDGEEVWSGKATDAAVARFNEAAQLYHD